MGVGVSTIPVQKQKVQLTVLPFFCILNNNNNLFMNYKNKKLWLNVLSDSTRVFCPVILISHEQVFKYLFLYLINSHYITKSHNRTERESPSHAFGIS